MGRRSARRGRRGLAGQPNLRLGRRRKTESNQSRTRGSKSWRIKSSTAVVKVKDARHFLGSGWSGSTSTCSDGVIQLRPGCVIENVKIRTAIALFLALGIGAATAPAVATADMTPAGSERVVLAGGCFWGMQLVFEELKGVDRVVAGYAGGNANTAQYETVSTGATGHAESVEVTYDPAKISFKTLLNVYFKVAHDPTELNRQGPDEGSHYGRKFSTRPTRNARRPLLRSLTCSKRTSLRRRS